MISSFASIRQAQIPAIAGLFVSALILTACTDGSDLSDAAERLQSPYVESVEEIPPFYYRVQASYTLKETGEQIDFDYVVACGGIATRWAYTSPVSDDQLSPQIDVSSNLERRGDRCSLAGYV